MSISAHNRMESHLALRDFLSSPENAADARLLRKLWIVLFAPGKDGDLSHLKRIVFLGTTAKPNF